MRQSSYRNKSQSVAAAGLSVLLAASLTLASVGSAFAVDNENLAGGGGPKPLTSAGQDAESEKNASGVTQILPSGQTVGSLPLSQGESKASIGSLHYDGLVYEAVSYTHLDVYKRQGHLLFTRES